MVGADGFGALLPAGLLAIQRVRSVYLAVTPQIELSGSTITLGPASPGRNQPRSPLFEFLPDARAVYEQILAVQANAGRSE